MEKSILIFAIHDKYRYVWYWGSLNIVAEAQKAKREESLGMYDLESYSAILLSVIAQWKRHLLPDHAVHVWIPSIVVCHLWKNLFCNDRLFYWDSKSIKFPKKVEQNEWFSKFKWVWVRLEFTTENCYKVYQFFFSSLLFRNVCFSKPFFWKRQVCSSPKPSVIKSRRFPRLLRDFRFEVRKRLPFYQSLHERVWGRGNQEVWRKSCQSLRIRASWKSWILFWKHSVFEIRKVLEIKKNTPSKEHAQRSLPILDLVPMENLSKV